MVYENFSTITSQKTEIFTSFEIFYLAFCDYGVGWELHGPCILAKPPCVYYMHIGMIVCVT